MQTDQNFTTLSWSPLLNKGNWKFQKDIHTEPLSNNWWCCHPLLLIGPSALKVPSPAPMGGVEHSPQSARLACFSDYHPLLSSTMMGLWLPRGPCVAAVVLMLMVLSRPVALVRDPQCKCTPQGLSCCGWGRQGVSLILSTLGLLKLAISSLTTSFNHTHLKLFPYERILLLWDLWMASHMGSVPVFLHDTPPAWHRIS